MEITVILGANGQVGTELQKALSGSRDRVMPFTRKEIDVRNLDQLENLLFTIRPNVIYNTTAFHKVDLCEDEEQHGPAESMFVNALVPYRIARVAGMMGTKFVHISSDYVFGADETRATPYVEYDHTGPVNWYGKSKVEGENLVLRANPDALIVRTAGIQGLTQSTVKKGNFIETMLRLGKERGKVSVVNDQIMSPTYAPDLATQLIIACEADISGVVHATSDGSCSWYEFAKAIFEEAGMRDVVVEPVDSSRFPTKATRPAYSVLDNARLRKEGLDYMGDWRGVAAKYMRERAK